MCQDTPCKFQLNPMVRLRVMLGNVKLVSMLFLRQKYKIFVLFYLLKSAIVPNNSSKTFIPIYTTNSPQLFPLSS